jgi:hypothetical protein
MHAARAHSFMLANININARHSHTSHSLSHSLSHLCVPAPRWHMKAADFVIKAPVTPILGVMCDIACDIGCVCVCVCV